MRLRAFTLALLLSSALAAHAQGPEDAPPPDYERLVSEALTESAEGRWAEARALFWQAHEVFPNARTLRGIGVVSFELRDYVESLRALRAALEDPRRPLTDTQRAEAEAVIERASAFVAQYALDALPEGARLVVDGHPARIEPDGTVMLAVGEHRVVVRMPTHESEARLTVRGGERGPLPVVVEPPPIAAAPPHAERSVAPPPPAEPPLAAWGLTIGGAVVAVVGGVLLALGVADLARVENAEAGTEWAELDASYGRAPVLTGLGAALLGAGAAASITGGVWLGVSSADGATAGLRVGGAF